MFKINFILGAELLCYYEGLGLGETVFLFSIVVASDQTKPWASSLGFIFRLFSL